MPLQECGLNLSARRRELQPHGTPEFPCAAYRTVVGGMEEIPWHWHEELEVAYAVHGQIKFQLYGKELLLEEGEGVFINRGVLHAAGTSDSCELISMVFHPVFVAGPVDSVFEKKYGKPLLECRSMEGMRFRQEGGWQENWLRSFQDAFAAFETGGWGYELVVREKLSHLWYLMVMNLRGNMAALPIEKNTDALRLKIMLDFIHCHYAEPLDLGRICREANIGQRECQRCFQRTIGISPMQYLLKCRVSEGARLLQETNGTVAEIAARCGFDSPSHFSQIFKKFHTCTPMEYRKRMAGP